MHFFFLDSVAWDKIVCVKKENTCFQVRPGEDLAT